MGKKKCIFELVQHTPNLINLLVRILGLSWVGREKHLLRGECKVPEKKAKIVVEVLYSPGHRLVLDSLGASGSPTTPWTNSSRGSGACLFRG